MTNHRQFVGASVSAFSLTRNSSDFGRFKVRILDGKDRPHNRLRGELADGRHQPYPDPKQEASFFGLFRECVGQGVISESLFRDEVAKNHIRHDTLGLLDRPTRPAV